MLQLASPESVGQPTALPHRSSAEPADVARERRPAHGAAAVTLGQNQLTVPESVGLLTALPQWRSAAVTLGRSDELTDECLIYNCLVMQASSGSSIS